MKMRLRNLTILSSVTLLMAAGCGSAGEADPIPRRDLYDYSSPEAAFRSYQKAVRREDLEGVIIHEWYIMKLSGKSAFASSTNFPGLLQQYRAQTNLSCGRFDATPPYIGGGKLKWSQARFVRELSRTFTEQRGGIMTCAFIVDWPDAGKQVELSAYKFVAADQWWFLPLVGQGDPRIKAAAGTWVRNFTVQ
jgi:hypothetical protein